MSRDNKIILAIAFYAALMTMVFHTLKMNSDDSSPVSNIVFQMVSH